MKHSYGSSSSRFFAIVLFAALTSGVGFAPSCALAQEAAPTAPAASAQNPYAQGPLPAQPGQVHKEEAEEHNLFRHTALVASISDAIFHDDKTATDPEKLALREQHIESTARGFEWINAAILYLCVLIPLFKFLPKVMRRRSQSLRQNLEDARKTTADAQSRLSAVEAQLARLDEEIAKIRRTVEEESKQDELRIKASIEEESARIVASAEQEIASAAAQAQRGLRNFAADLAIDHAVRQLTLTPEMDRALIAEFVSETTNGKMQGGRN